MYLVSAESIVSMPADVDGISAALACGNAPPAGATTGVANAAADEVSTAIAALFSVVFCPAGKRKIKSAELAENPNRRAYSSNRCLEIVPWLCSS
jgi:PE family